MPPERPEGLMGVQAQEADHLVYVRAALDDNVACWRRRYRLARWQTNPSKCCGPGQDKCSISPHASPSNIKIAVIHSP